MTFRKKQTVCAMFVIGIIVGNVKADWVTDTIPAGTNPFAVAVNPVTNRTFVANYGSGAVTVALSSGTMRSLAIGAKKTSVNAFWVRVPEKQYTYLVNEDVQKKLDKKPGDFKPQPPAPAAKKGAPAGKPAAKMNPPSQEKLKKAIQEFKAKKNK